MFSFKKKAIPVLLVIVLVVACISASHANDKELSHEELLEGSFVREQDGWDFIHLEGAPYQIGYQRGYHAAESAHYWLIGYVGTEGFWTEWRRETAETIWPMIPEEYQQEIDGIVDGMHARGYDDWDRWDVVAANAWADWAVYRESCSAFIATGDATTDGQIVTGHITMYDKNLDFMYNIIFDVTPDEGYRFRYQSAGASMWSGQDWYVNDAGMTVKETSLRNPVRNPEGTPVFVRIREAVQYTDNIDDFIDVMTTDNSGAYPNEWLVGDTKTGEILSLMLGCYAWDINRTFDGFYPSCNYPYYDNFREEAGLPVPAPDPEDSGVPRVERWAELIDEYYGQVDVEVGKLMLEDDIIASYEPTRRGGGYDGKVTNTEMVQEDMGQWARWGNPAGKPFDLDGYLEEMGEDWVEDNPDIVENLQRYVDSTPQPWTYMALVDIDIKPSINLRSRGVVPVKVLTTDYFDADNVDPSTVTFAGAEPVRWTNGEKGMLLHFNTQDLDLTEGCTEATMSGMTHAGGVFEATSTVKIAP